MSWILLLALAQTPETKPTIEDRVAAFLKGDGAARAELLRLGVRAIRPLQKARETGPRSIDYLVFEIKMAAAYPSAVALPQRFAERQGLVTNRQWPEPGLLAQVFQQKGIPLFTDRFDSDRLKPAQMVMFNPESPLQLIEMFCKDTGLDYGFFHNSVVIGRSERLWPDHSPAKVTSLDELGLDLARSLMAKLEDPSIETREAASRGLVALGSGVIPLLESQRKGAGAELASRLDAILRVVAVRQGPFRPAACLGQKLTGGDEALLNKIKIAAPKLAFDRAEIREVLDTLGAAHGMSFEISPDHAKNVTTIHTSGQTLLDVLSLITQSHDLDFLISGGKVVIDTRGAIEKRLAPGK